MCSRVTPYSHCKWIIPRVYGKCQCLPDHVFTKDDQQCWPSKYRCLYTILIWIMIYICKFQHSTELHQRCESSMECERATANSYCTSESFVSNRLLTTFSRSLADNVQRAALQSSNTGNGRSSNRKHYHKAMRMSSRSWHRSASRQNNIWSQQDSIPTLYRNHASEGSHCACSDGFEQNESLDACVSNRPSTESPSIELMEEQASSHDRLSVSSLGKSCRSSLECRLRDPHSHCVSGVCQCIVNNGSCSANNTGKRF